MSGTVDGKVGGWDESLRWMGKWVGEGAAKSTWEGWVGGWVGGWGGGHRVESGAIQGGYLEAEVGDEHGDGDEGLVEEGLDAPGGVDSAHGGQEGAAAVLCLFVWVGGWVG